MSFVFCILHGVFCFIQGAAKYLFQFRLDWRQVQGLASPFHPPVFPRNLDQVTWDWAEMLSSFSTISIILITFPNITLTSLPKKPPPQLISIMIILITFPTITLKLKTIFNITMMMTVLTRVVAGSSAGQSSQQHGCHKSFAGDLKYCFPILHLHWFSHCWRLCVWVFEIDSSCSYFLLISNLG